MLAKRSRLFLLGLLLSVSGLASPVGAPAFAQSADPAGWGAAAPILDKHCARCHEAGKTTGRFKDTPAGQFGFVLDEEDLIKRNKLIPGNADASEIFVKILKGDMPKDMDDECLIGTATDKNYCGLSEAEKAALHTAINALKAPAPEAQVAAAAPTASAPAAPILAAPTTAAPVAPAAPAAAPAPPPVVAVAAPFMKDRDIIRLISADLAQANTTDAANYRYLTFTHFYNAGEPEKDMRVYRMALSKVLNSLSTQPDPVVPVAIDPAQTIYRIDLRGLGWSRATWDAIAASDPYATLYNDAQFKAMVNDLHTVTPFVRADWFTFAAARPPLYYAILDLPRTKQELQAKLGLNVARDFQDRRIQRAGFQLSGVSDNNRLVERHTIGTGAYWESYDFGSNGDRKSLFQFPLGPPGAFGELSDKFGFQQDGGEIIFALPNGFHAYYLSDGKGNRLDTGPTRIVRDPSQRDLAVTDGISCMGCHDKGIKFNDRRPGQPLDQIRDLILHSASYPAQVKEIVGEIFPTGEAFNKQLETDAKRYADALAAASVNMNTKASGVEMVNALSKRFEDNLDARLAAAEFGLTQAEFMDRLDAVGGEAHDLKLRLQQDLVPRDQFVALYARLANSLDDQGDTTVDLTKVALQAGTTAEAIANGSKKSPQSSKTFDLAFFANATDFKVGDLVTFSLRSEQPCFLTLLDTDDQGRSQILFPNSFHTDGRIAASKTIQIPGPEVGGFQLRAPDTGTERITATCNASFPDFAPPDPKKPATVYASSRDLIAARTNQQRAASRLLVVEQSPGAAVRPGVVGNLVAAATPAAAQQLVANPIDPSVPITAQKSVVLNVRAN